MMSAAVEMRLDRLLFEINDSFDGVFVANPRGV